MKFSDFVLSKIKVPEKVLCDSIHMALLKRQNCNEEEISAIRGHEEVLWKAFVL